MNLTRPFSIVTKKERPYHVSLWILGFVLVNIPSWEVTMGVFHSDDYSLFIPSVYGALMNAYLLYALSHELLTNRFSRKAFLATGMIYVVITGVESLFDILYFRVHYGFISNDLLMEVIWSQLLMNAIFFYLLAVMYGLAKSLKKEEVIDSKEVKIQVKDGNQTIFLEPHSLTHIESDGNYCIYHSDKKNLVRQSLKQAESALPDYFVRCHKSFIINAKLIRKQTYNHIAVGEHTIPIGRKYRTELKSYLTNS